MNIFKPVAATMIGIAAYCVSPSAGAAPPEPFGFDVTVDAGVFCDFAVRVVVEGRTKSILHGDRLLVTAPGQRLTLTNLATNKVLMSSLAGVFHNLTLGDGSVMTKATGRNLLGDPVAGLVITAGNFSFTTAPDGSNAVPLHGNGRMVPVCAALG